MMTGRLSIRARIILGSTAIMVLLVVAACLAVYAQISSIAVSREKAVLHGIAEVYRGIILEDPGEPFEKPGVDQHVAIIAPSGEVRMNTLPKALAGHLAELAAPGDKLRETRYGDQTYFVYVQPVQSPAGDWTVLVTRDSDIASGIVSRAVELLWVVVIGSAALFAFGSWVIATAALRPVERLRRSADELAQRRQDPQLLPVGRTDDEIDSLARTLNRLIADARASAAREQQMVADASHELRNPLTVLRAQLELVDGTDPAADRVLLAEARRTLNRLIRLAQSILELSRIDAGGSHAETPLSDLAAELTERVDHLRWRLAEPASGLTGEIELSIGSLPSAALARLSASDLGTVVDNLVDNALHAARGDDPCVHVALTQQDDELVLTVADNGSGFDPQVVDRAFERFARGPSSAYEGGGLGLAIVARVAERAGGRASITPSPMPADTAIGSRRSGAEVVVRFPIVREVDDRSPNTHQR